MLHKDLANSRWQKMSLTEQLANIGSEYFRFAASKDANLKQQSQARMLELLDLTLSDPRFRLRLKELARLREAVCGEADANLLKSYFLSFAQAARK